MWTSSKRAAGSVNLSSGLTVCWDTLDCRQGWQASAQVRQSFCTPGHTNRWEMSLAVPLVPGWSRLCRQSNIYRHRVLGHMVVVFRRMCHSTASLLYRGWEVFSRRRAVFPSSMYVWEFVKTEWTGGGSFLNVREFGVRPSWVRYLRRCCSQRDRVRSRVSVKRGSGPGW